MCAPNNTFVMTKPNDPSERTIENSQSTKSKYDFMFIDCCSFLGLGLGMADDFRISPYASVALMDTNDDMDSFLLGDTDITSDSSTLFHDLSDANSEKESKGNNEEDTKAIDSILTISTVTMEQAIKGKRIVNIEEEDEDLPSRLTLLSENYLSVDGTTLFDEEESKTLNTLSTHRLPSSLDTKTLELPPSLDTKTLDMTLEGLELVETTLGDTTEADTGRNLSNPSYSRPRSLYDIDRVPSLVDFDNSDDQSLVSTISVEQEDIKGKTASTFCERKLITKRLFNGKSKIRKPWQWNKKKAHEVEEREPADGLPLPSIPVSRTKGITILPSEPSRSVISTSQPTGPNNHTAETIGNYGHKDSPSTKRQPPKSPASVYRFPVPMITMTKSNDVTATTISTDEGEYCYQFGDNVPFDEPHACSHRLLEIEQFRTRQ